MQTWFTHPDPAETAEHLDNKRLLSQVKESGQIIAALAGAKGWSRHPATLMWAGHEQALRAYHDVMRSEWLSRGYQWSAPAYGVTDVELPPWARWRALYANHRGRLVRKLPGHYQGSFGARGYDGCLWPSADGSAARLDVRFPFSAELRLLFRSGAFAGLGCRVEGVRVGNLYHIRAHIEGEPAVEEMDRLESEIRAIAAAG